MKNKIIQVNKSSYDLTTFDQNSSLSTVLIKLSQKLSDSNNEISHQQLIIKLLLKIDQQYFHHKFHKTQIYKYQLIIKQIVDYYQYKYTQKINNNFLLTLHYSHQFQHLFVLVLDLAFNCYQKQRYIQSILQMDQNQKLILLPYINQITKRSFIQKLQFDMLQQDNPQIKNTQYDEILQSKDQQCQQLKQRHEQLQKIYAQLNDNYHNLKLSFDKLSTQNLSLQNDKIQLINQLGLHNLSTYSQIAYKYKKDIKSYESQVQKLTKQLQQQTKKIEKKQYQIKAISQQNKNTWQSQQKQLQNYNKKLQQKLAQYQKNQQLILQQLQNSKIFNNKLLQDLQIKNKQINHLLKIKNKFLVVKQAHFQFKKNFVERMRQN